MKFKQEKNLMRYPEFLKKEWLYRLCGTILWLQH